MPSRPFKTLLLGTSALAAGSLLAASQAAAEEGIKLGLGGYMNAYFGGGEVDSDDGTDYGHTGLFSDGEIYFSGETTLDNGLTFGAEIALEAFASTPQMSDNFGYMEGGFGRLEFGSLNSAAYMMHYAAPVVGVPINSGWVTSFVPAPSGFNATFESPALSTYIDVGAAENKLNYYTPRLFGFQLGLTYIPTVSNQDDGANFPVQADESSQSHDAFSVGLNFVESFGSVDMALSGGYTYAAGPDDAVTVLFPANTATTNGQSPQVVSYDQNDTHQVVGGINLGFAGFTIGGSVAAELEGRLAPATAQFDNTVDFVSTNVLPGPYPAGTVVFDGATYTSDIVSNEGWSWDVGASYATGPWAFGVQYFQGITEGSVFVNGYDELRAGSAAVSYAVGPGITASLSGLYADWEDETGLESDGIVGVAGITLEY